MREKPNLQDKLLVASLRDHYGLRVAALDFLPLGNDSSAWVYKVHADSGKSYFLKVKKGQVYEPSLAVPRYLKDRGIEQIVAPLPTSEEKLWVRVENFALILYPFIDGGTGMEVGMSDSQWIEFGAVVKKIHTIHLSSELSRQLRRETFDPKWSGVVQVLQAKIGSHHHDDEWEKELALIWKEKRVEIQKIIDRVEELGRGLQQQASEFVLCHADMHTFNLLLDHEGKLFIVDWDETLLAPKERDLMFVGAGIGDAASRARETELFFQGYGKTAVDPVTVAYYRYEWVFQEIGDYGERVFLMQDVGEETKKESVYYFRKLFETGDVADRAYQTEANLPR